MIFWYDSILKVALSKTWLLREKWLPGIRCPTESCRLQTLNEKSQPKLTKYLLTHKDSNLK